MTQTTSPLADHFAKFLTDAAGMAQGLRKESETFVKTQAERMLSGLDIPSREEFEALRAMAQKAREENEVLKDRLMALEEKIGQLTAKKTK